MPKKKMKKQGGSKGGHMMSDAQMRKMMGKNMETTPQGRAKRKR